MRILIAQQDAETVAIVRAAITPEHVVVEANDGDATALLITEASERGSPFDLLILDLQMPGMPGLEVLALLRSLEEPRKLAGGVTTRVLIVSESTSGRFIYGAHAMSCDGYLVKPLDVDKFREALDRVCPRQ
jgi:two-component system chemotaxis response regulator CheY